MLLKIVFDANIYLAAMGSRSFCYDLLVKLSYEQSKYPLFVSEAIIGEVKKNAQRLVQEGIINETQKRQILDFMATVPNLVFPEEEINLLKDNPKDNKILTCAVAATADLIVTMDRQLLKLKRFGTIGIVHPESFSYILPNKNEEF